MKNGASTVRRWNNLAAQAERASIKYKMVEFMAERVGNTYEGVISGVTEWGLYVEINENKCGGMIPIRDWTMISMSSMKRVIALRAEGNTNAINWDNL
jgi:exoribonuclease R